MYSLSSQSRRQEEDEEDNCPPSPPSRKSENQESFTRPSTNKKSSGSGGGVLASAAKKQPPSQKKFNNRVESELHYSYEEEPSSSRTPHASGKAKMPGASRVGAVAVRGITSDVAASPSTVYSYTSTNRSIHTVQEEVPQSEEQDSPIEATRVEDEEADVEAQVQSRMQDQAKDIAQMVHRELVNNMAVPVDVQPSVGDTFSITTEGQDKRSSAEDVKKRRLCLIAIGLVAVVAAIGAGAGVAISKKSKSTPPENGKCSFCHNAGFVPTNLDNETVVFEGKTCAELFERQTSLDPTDPKCTSGQAIAWNSCDCPTLPPPPENPTCTLCEDGAVPSGLNCKDVDNFLAIVGGVLASCDDLKSKAFRELGCTCGNDPVVALQSVLEPLSGEALKDTDSPQFEALDWIANKDAAKLSVQTTNAETIRIRYVAALLYHAFGGHRWSDRYKFLTEGDVCTWNENGLGGFEFGIVCDSDGNIEWLRLPENNLVGSIPQEIGYLSTLKLVDVANNTIGGDLPASLENLTRLETFNLTENALTGTLPEFLFTHQQLRILRLDDNGFSGTISPMLGTSPKLTVFSVRGSKLTGSIPSNVGQSSVLGSVNFHGNQLTGTIPDFVSSAPKIWDFLAGDNKLVGTVPRSIGSLPNLIKFSASGNELRGSIPSELAQCTYLRHLFLHNNTYMTGTLPTELGTLRFLQSFYLSNNRFQGSIPSELGNLRLLQNLALLANRFNGSIPTELRGCASLVFMDFAGNYLNGNLGAALGSFPRILESFDVSENKLTGTIPTLIGEFSSLEWFDVQSNELVGTIPTEVGSLSQLETFVVAYNGFNGTFPSILASLPKLTWLRVQGNELTGDLNAFCAGTFESLVGNVCSEPETLDCACCTHCCRPETFVCEPL